MSSFIRHHWSDLIILAGYFLVFLYLLLWILLSQSHKDQLTLTIVTISLITIGVTGPIALYAFIKKVQKHQQETNQQPVQETNETTNTYE